MAFATALRASLQTHRSELPRELANGHSLERILSRHLLTVEQQADHGLLTSILLLDREQGRLWHGAAPSLPAAYCSAIDGGEIGPAAGSCGTAAYLGRPVYVTDIASDPLWADYRDLALAHDLRSCWSTPIRDFDEKIIGTFAIYRRTIASPTPHEVEAIELITEHVADAIILAQAFGRGPAKEQSKKPMLRLVRNEGLPSAPAQDFEGLLRSLRRLQAHSEELDRCVGLPEFETSADALRATAKDCRRLVRIIQGKLAPYGYPSS